MDADILLINATVLNADGSQSADQALAIKDGWICWKGSHLPEMDLQYAAVHDCQGKLVTPGLIDCHTHLVYAGTRANEFKLRMAGASYADIARAGGGILSTVSATRQASEEELFHHSMPRLKALAKEGVTSIEIKSGYGLDWENEVKMLKVARQLGQETGIRVKTTFLGAHALAPEYQGRQQDYVDWLSREAIPLVSELKLADAVDVFCESIAFDLKQTEQLFEAAKGANLAVKCHAEQLSNMGGAKLAAGFGALSCDHLEYLDEDAVKAMAASNTTAVLLPGAFYFLAETRLPPLEALRRHQVPVAIATDSNPGSSPTASLQLMMSMACRFFNMTVPEVMAAVTLNAAKALGMDDELGEIAVGRRADLVLWDTDDSAILCYHFGMPVAHQTMLNGRWINFE